MQVGPYQDSCHRARVNLCLRINDTIVTVSLYEIIPYTHYLKVESSQLYDNATNGEEIEGNHPVTLRYCTKQNEICLVNSLG